MTESAVGTSHFGVGLGFISRVGQIACMLNVFQIWDANGRKLPFVVRRANWKEQFAAVIERIECDEMPYGKAFGYSTTYGRPSNHFQMYPKWRKTKEVPNAGSYQWELVNVNPPQSKEVERPQMPKEGKSLTLDSELGFGKYRGKKVRDVLQENPNYIQWASANVKGLSLDEETMAALKSS
jgi:hypothetical protein